MKSGTVTAQVQEKGSGEPKRPAAVEPIWPTHFPPGCPSESTPNVSGEVYRVIYEPAGPVPQDWPSHAERCSERKKGTAGCKNCMSVSLCQSGSLSVRVTYADAVVSLEKIRLYNARYQAIAKATLTPEHGKIAQTGDDDKTHYSLWLRSSALKEACTLFAVVPSEVAK